ncbi:DinB family protein [Deinococcus altitudinis]|uniref:DinB family protein n=1 Tax=Deinococcus altitudinis TaxID=468914 RepID=UPI0038913BBA
MLSAQTTGGAEMAGSGETEGAEMTEDQSLLAALLEAWNRNTTILTGLLRALPAGGLEARALKDSPSVAQLFMHLHFVRVCAVYENDPQIAAARPELRLDDRLEWVAESDPERIATLLQDSAELMRSAFRGWVEERRGRVGVYAHPVLLLQHVLWHEAYHTGQIKLVLKAAGLGLSDEVAGPVTWDVWRRGS